MATERVKNCFWRHQWTKWEDIGEGRSFWIWEKDNPKAGRPILVQERRCERCNAAVRRKVELT